MTATGNGAKSEEQNKETGWTMSFHVKARKTMQLALVPAECILDQVWVITGEGEGPDISDVMYQIWMTLTTRQGYRDVTVEEVK